MSSTNHVYGDYTVTDYRDVSRQAAERHAQLAAVNQSRTQRIEQKREAVAGRPPIDIPGDRSDPGDVAVPDLTTRASTDRGMSEATSPPSGRPIPPRSATRESRGVGIEEPTITKERNIMNSTTQKPMAGIIAAIIVGVLAIGGVAAALVVMLGPVSASATSSSQGDSRRVVVQPSADGEARTGATGPARLLHRADRRLPQPRDRSSDHRSAAFRLPARDRSAGSWHSGRAGGIGAAGQQPDSGLPAVDGVDGQRQHHPIGTTRGVELPERSFGRLRIE